ncbi:diaminopimelate decarboxylase [Agrilactobacillus fermenti]|uniref:diaminopimelate decarboxylase n=1 Tax=Agrilactobacillus fermenti TaxID=2586909 RepID=UPI001E503C31|nr:diaminopimelate decarboxylase [Agrilactobacillus fermenti]MCD2255826.1 diaminopimelate decarboxylase [Agrilactobacillus fermenti]
MSYYHYGTMSTNAAGHLAIGGVDTLDLAREFGTPLYVYDVALIRERIRAFKRVFETRNIDYHISYASKAFSTKAMYRILTEEGIGADVVSGGEIYTAQSAGFDMSQASFNGNNKSAAELKAALAAGVGHVIIDNFHEIELLESILAATQQQLKVLIRVTPGISAHTHEYDMTGQVDSKFGFDIQSGQADKAVQQIQRSKFLKYDGLHVHIGSQIFETVGFEKAADALIKLATKWTNELNITTNIFNVGGGFGVRYSTSDTPLAPQVYVEDIVDEILKQTQAAHLKQPAIWIEPGRSIVAEAGTTLYTIGARKDIPNVRSYVAVDGGMGDNIRPALYQAKYEAALCNDPEAAPIETVAIAGKYCESGDMLIWDQPLPKTVPGDILATFVTGAYGYAMANNYNRNPRPAIVFVENNQAQLVVKRESYADLTRLDI